MNLSEKSLRWAFKHILAENDTDLFPTLKEYDFFKVNEDDLLNELGKIDIGNFIWQPSRRFIIPKAEYSYRVATQLDPIDSILFAAMIYEIGGNIEKKRIPTEENKVFSYRFEPNDEGQLYNREGAWKNFWTTAKGKMDSNNVAVYIDIADFYNRIYHHSLENQMVHCNIPNQIIKGIINLIQNTTQTVSQGIPVEPHSSHLLAEMCLISIDDSLNLKGIDFCRYVDDIIIFTDNEIHAKLIIYEMARMLDAMHLSMQKQKTRVYNKDEFIKHCDSMLNDNPINDLEENILNTLGKYSTDPYGTIDFLEIAEDDKLVFAEYNINEILESYMGETIDYQRIRWLYKRLSQVGVSTAVELTLNKIDDLIPVINDISLYFLSVANSNEQNLHNVGDRLIKLLENEIVQSNDFFQLTILSLFEHSSKFNNIEKLIRLYPNANDHLKREIILSAFSSNATSWVRELKQQYESLSIWSKKAFLMASSLLPRDERKFFLKSIHINNGPLTIGLLEKYIKTI